MEILKISYGYFSSVMTLFIFFIIRHFRSRSQCTLPAVRPHFSMHSIWGMARPNTRAYSDLPAVDILNFIHKAAAAMSPLATSFVQVVYFAVLIVLFIELFSGLKLWIDIPSTSKCRQLKQTVYQLNRPIHHGGCQRLGDQNKHTCQEVTGITELFKAWCCQQSP